MKKYQTPIISVEALAARDVINASVLGFMDNGEGEYTSWNDIFKS